MIMSKKVSFLLISILCCFTLFSCVKDRMSNDIDAKWPDAITTTSGLKYVVTAEGEGDATPTKGDVISAHYTGKLLDGTKFDSSVDRGEPFKTAIGVGQVIAGWDEAFLSMKKGEKRTLIIPSDLAYGDNGYPGLIPPKATLVFDVELLGF